MVFAVQTGRMWVWAIFCVALSLISLCGLAYRLLRLPTGERLLAIKGQWQNFRDHMSGKNDAT
jgi:hypothetical protein